MKKTTSCFLLILLLILIGCTPNTDIFDPENYPNTSLHELTITINDKPVTNGEIITLPVTVQKGGTLSIPIKLANAKKGYVQISGSPKVNSNNANTDEFSIEDTRLKRQLYQDETSDFILICTPKTTGLKRVTIIIEHNSPDDPLFSFTIKLTAVSTKIEVTAGENPIPPNSAFSITSNAGEKHTFTIHNHGNIPLNLSGQNPVTITGPDAAHFTLTQPAVQIIESDESADFSITFTPMSPGVKKGYITINPHSQSDDNFTFEIVTGNALPILTITETDGTRLTSGQTSHMKGSTKRFILSNTGNAPLTLDSFMNTNIDDFTLTGPAKMVLYQDETTDFTLNFSPQSPGIKTTTILIVTNDAGTSYFQLPIKSYNAKAELLITDSMDTTLDLAAPFVFQNTDYEKESAKKILLKNSGNHPLTIEQTALIAGQDFTLTQGFTGSILPGESKELVISFKPVSAGKKEGLLSIVSDMKNVNLQLAASDFEPGFLITDQSGAVITAAHQLVLTDDTKKFIITNTGNAPLTLDSFMNTNIDDFTLTGPDNMVLYQDETTDFTLKFSPQSPGIKTTTILIVTNDAGTSYFQLPIKSYNARADLVITDMAGSVVNSQAAIDFTGAPYYMTNTHSFIITNRGNYPLTIGSVKLTGDADFTITESFSGQIDPGTKKIVTVAFKPLTAGSKEALLTIDSDVTTIIRPIQAPTFIPDFIILDEFITSYPHRSTLVFYTTTNSESYGQELTLSNNGNFPLIVESITIAGPNAGLFTYGQAGSQADGFTLAPGQDRLITLTFTPGSDYGSKNATLSFKTNHPNNGSFELNLKTNGVGPELKVLQDSSKVLNNGDVVNLQIPESTNKLQHELPITLKNINAFYDLTIDSIEITGKDKSNFRTSGFSLPVKLTMGNDTIAGKIIYTPSSRSAKEVELVITSNTKEPTARTFKVTLKTPELAGILKVTNEDGEEVKNNGIDYFKIPEYSSTGYTRTYTIKNTGNYPIVIPNPSLSGTMGEVTLSTTSTLTINQGGSRTVTVTYKPTTPIVKNMALHLDYKMDNELTKAHAINIITDKLKPEVEVKVSNWPLLSMTVIQPNTTYNGFGNHYYDKLGTVAKTKTFTIRNNGTFPINLSAIKPGGTNQDDFTIDTINFDTGKLLPDKTTNFTIKFTPKGVGQRSADITIQTDNDDVTFTCVGKLHGQVTRTIEYSEPGEYTFTVRHFVPDLDHVSYENVTATLTLVGGGGGGGTFKVHATLTPTQFSYIQGGGGAGEYVTPLPTRSLNQHTTYTIVVGEGGTAGTPTVAAPNGQTGTKGTNGQITTFKGGGINLTAKAGSAPSSHPNGGAGYPDGAKGRTSQSSEFKKGTGGDNGFQGYGNGGTTGQSGQHGYFKIEFTADVVEY